MTRERIGGFYIEGERFAGWKVWPVDGEEREARWFIERYLAIAYAAQHSPEVSA